MPTRPSQNQDGSTVPTGTNHHLLDRNLHVIFSISFIVVMGVSSLTPVSSAVLPSIGGALALTGWYVPFALPIIGLYTATFLSFAVLYGAYMTFIGSRVLVGSVGCGGFRDRAGVELRGGPHPPGG
ncbi:MAG: hypothetical protein HKO65_01165 [Gemmatimonadetes bacterium]|nr:hypothetical protein [Gemmatimonadota bacterium]NNM03683.1 hypothetical protein [Gemmatimonadota bacterium]